MRQHYVEHKSKQERMQKHFQIRTKCHTNNNHDQRESSGKKTSFEIKETEGRADPKTFRAQREIQHWKELECKWKQKR